MDALRVRHRQSAVDDKAWAYRSGGRDNQPPSGSHSGLSTPALVTEVLTVSRILRVDVVAVGCSVETLDLIGGHARAIGVDGI